MSSAQLEASKYIIMVRLSDLNKPYKLSKWMQLIPHYKKQYLQLISRNDDDDDDTKQIEDEATTNDEDIKICEQLSEFMFRNQVIGQHLITNFTKNDFINLLTVATTNTAHDIYRYLWIWKCIEYSQKNTAQADKMRWVSNSWAQFQTILDAERIKQLPPKPSKQISIDEQQNTALIAVNNDKKSTAIHNKKDDNQSSTIEPVASNSSLCGCCIL